MLNGDYASSDAVNVVYNEDEIVDGLTKKSGPRHNLCTITNTSDPMVDVGVPSNGGSCGKADSGNGLEGGFSSGSAGKGDYGRTCNLEEVNDGTLTLLQCSTIQSTKLPRYLTWMWMREIVIYKWGRYLLTNQIVR